MFAGHFGVAAAVKAMEPKIPLWALMVSTQLLDLAFVPLLLAGVESIEPIGEGGYGEAIIHADYSHSLIGAFVLTIIASFFAWRMWNRRSAVVIGSLTFSHWLFDLLVHRSDMPILPGNIGGLPLLGLRLWELSAVSASVEILLVVLGAVLYFRSALARSKGKTRQGVRTTAAETNTQIRRAYFAGTLMAVLLVLSFVTDYFSI